MSHTHTTRISLATLCRIASCRVAAYIYPRFYKFKRTIFRSHPPAPTMTSRRKALLIGINYAKVADDDSQELSGPHHDVLEVKKILMSLYHYDEKDIAVMLDGVTGEAREPTRANIIKQIQLLVQDAQPGDHFFFHFSGHSTQVKNRTGTEEDGQDEAIMTIDNQLVIDDELRRHLVDTLPAGSTLVAIFDTCHSGSLLDLDHHRCNRVWVPWENKGIRSPDPKRNFVVRRRDICCSKPYTRKRSGESAASSRKQSAKSTASLKRLEIDPNDPPLSPIRQTDSPIARFCDGWCRGTWPIVEGKAHVICLSAAKDSQMAWEWGNESMTMAIVRVLQTNPYPSLRDLMTHLSHEIHRLSLVLHEVARKKRLLELQPNPDPELKNLPDFEMNNFQNPQLSSHNPLDLDSIFTL